MCIGAGTELRFGELRPFPPVPFEWVCCVPVPWETDRRGGRARAVDVDAEEEEEEEGKDGVLAAAARELAVDEYGLLPPSPLLPPLGVIMDGIGLRAGNRWLVWRAENRGVPGASIALAPVIVVGLLIPTG